MHYIGLDLGTKWIYGTIISGAREVQVLKEAKFPCNTEALEKFLGGIPKDNISVAIEACGIWTDIYDYLCERCHEVRVANPLQTAWIGKSKKKTDRIDSMKLAILLKGGLIIESYIPQKETRLFRRQIRHRQSLVAIRTSLKNQVHAIIKQDNIPVPQEVKKDIFTKKGMQWLRNLSNKSIDACLVLMPTVEKAVTDATESLDTNQFQKQIELLKTMPGVGDLTASVVMSEIADIDRFETAKRLCSYSGLVSSVYQSGNIDARGKITKQGSKVLRTALVQAAWMAVTKECRFKRYFSYMVDQRGKNSNKAIIAVARKMLYVMWFMLTRNQPYVDSM